MSDTGGLAAVLNRGRTNAALTWALTAFVGLVAVGSALRGNYLWAAFTAGIAALALIPPANYRDAEVMLPWEVLVLCALPVLGRALSETALTSRLATHLSVAAVALVVAVELDVFTPVRMTDWFAVLFVVVATMATAGAWALTQWLSDTYLGTSYLLTGAPEASVEAGVMWNFVWATAAGLVAGVVFEAYFRRRVRPKRRLPPEVREVVE